MKPFLPCLIPSTLWSISLWLVSTCCLLADEVKPLTPEQAIQKVNEKVVVQMTVKAAKNRLEKRGEIYLDSEEDFHNAKNLGIVVTRKGAAAFKKKGIDDPAAHFKDKKIQVTGTVLLKQERPRIEVDDPKQIQLINHK